MKPLQIFSLLLILCSVGRAEEAVPFERGLDLIRNEVRVAKTGIRALSVAGHPDDEDGGTLSYLRRTLGVETHMCLATRGEGGQNEAGPELGADLAVLRTRETEEAAAILGAKVWYLNLPDFGFSKSRDEALKIWGEEKALAQMVRVIRIVRPHILFTNHDPDGTDHGHHRATGWLAAQAFDAAADPERFKEEMKQDGTGPWQVSKMYLRRFAPPGSTLSFDISARDPLSGLSATEVGALALRRHVTQGMLRTLKVGERDMRYFTLLKSKLKKSDSERSMLDGITPETPADVAASCEKWLERLSGGVLNDAKGLNEFVTFALSVALELPGKHLNRAVLEACGIKTQISASDGIIAAGESVDLTVRIANTGQLDLSASVAVVGESSAWEGTRAGQEQPLAAGSAVEFKASARATDAAFPTYPPANYIWTRMQSRTPLQALIYLTVPGIKTEQMVATRAVPVELAVPREVSISPSPVLIFDDPDRPDHFPLPGAFRLVVTNRRKLAQPLKLFAGIQPKEDVEVDRPVALTFDAEDETQAAEFRSVAPVELLNRADQLVPTVTWTAEAQRPGPAARLRRVPLKLPPNLSVGIVKTYDDATLQALRKLEEANLGLAVTELSADDLRAADLNRYHTIILDLRATQYRPEVRQMRQRLQQFMRDGGNLVCMYHKDFDWNLPGKDQSVRGQGMFRGVNGGGEIAPYPIELSFDRVTDENAPVRLLKPDHPLLSQPCKIWERDFQGWVQERGVYFPKTWAAEYTALLASND
ncbi:MAG TPA: PIG-L family deacetylase, partial [Planctomycetota bacterium]|nr:PIG-L family deacetylase [Planctomycetota bacterium]